MQRSLLVKNFLTPPPVILKVSDLTTEKNPTCAKVMQLAAKRAEENKWPVVQFEHDRPPHFRGPEFTSKSVTLANTSLIELPQSLIHVGKEQIGVNGFAKLVPNYKKIVSAIPESA